MIDTFVTCNANGTSHQKLQREELLNACNVKIYDFILSGGKMPKTEKIIAERMSWIEKGLETQRYKRIEERD